MFARISDVTPLIPVVDGSGFQPSKWGSGGIGYFYWCDGCRISGGLWQCT